MEERDSDDRRSSGGSAIYKPGQGYWTRVLTAVGMGVLFLATAAWTFTQAELIPLPIKEWQLAVTGAPADIAVGAPVELQKQGDNIGDPPVRIGGAVVASYEAKSGGSGTLAIANVQMDGEQTPSDLAKNAVVVNGATVPVLGALPVPIFDPLYLQGGLTAVVLIFGAIVTYVLTAKRRDTCEFLIATDGEMKKVNWSTRREILGSTWVVIGATFLIAAFIFIVDTGFSQVFRLIGVLQK